MVSIETIMDSDEMMGGRGSSDDDDIKLTLSWGTDEEERETIEETMDLITYKEDVASKEKMIIEKKKRTFDLRGYKNFADNHPLCRNPRLHVPIHPKVGLMVGPHQNNKWPPRRDFCPSRNPGVISPDDPVSSPVIFTKNDIIKEAIKNDITIDDTMAYAHVWESSIGPYQISDRDLISFNIDDGDVIIDELTTYGIVWILLHERRITPHIFLNYMSYHLEDLDMPIILSIMKSSVWTFGEWITAALDLFLRLDISLPLIHLAKWIPSYFTRCDNIGIVLFKWFDTMGGFPDTAISRNVLQWLLGTTGYKLFSKKILTTIMERGYVAMRKEVPRKALFWGSFNNDIQYIINQISMKFPKTR